MIEQLSFLQNGNIAPCPYRSECYNHPAGCQGKSYWCKRYDKPKSTETKDDYIRENPTCFFVFGHYLDSADGWCKVPDHLPTFNKWTLIDVVLFGKKTGTAWMEHEKWEAKDWTFRSVDQRRDTETTEVLAWKISRNEK